MSSPFAGRGCAYAAVYEFDFHGNLLAFRDFAAGWHS